MNSVLVFVLAIIVVSQLGIVSAKSIQTNNVGRSEGPSNDLMLHIVPHTHDDTGWLKTVDEYHFGLNMSIQWAGTRYILDTVVEELVKDSKKTFMYVEMAFFTRWWNEQTYDRKEQVRKLVREGRLEFINGGWCMHDEANTHVYDMIDQMTSGHQFLLNEFGVRPSVGWQIDPFGHSSTASRLFSQMGMNSWFVARIDYQDYANRMNESTMEFVWRSSPSIGAESDILFGTLIDHYGPPKGFCFECGDDPVVDDDRLNGFNVQQRAEELITDAKWRAQHLTTNNVMYTMGSDFQYMDANLNYKNLDALIEYINAHSTKYGVRAMYSTPSRYTEALFKSSPKYTVKTDDFFPYADCPHCMWTGYFTSRAALKGYVRERSALFRSTHHLITTARFLRSPSFNFSSALETVQYMDDAMGVAQHHDAVAGTEKQHVADDYAQRLFIGTKQCQKVLVESVVQLSGNQGEWEVCDQRNTSLCAVAEETFRNDGSHRKLAVVVYNPLGEDRVNETLYIPVPQAPAGGFYLVTDHDGNLTPYSEIDNYNAENTTIAAYVSVPAFGWSTYYVRLIMVGEKPVPSETPLVRVEESSSAINLFSDKLEILVSKKTGMIERIVRLDQNIAANVTVDMRWYMASPGDDVSSQASGAYIFRPVGDESISARQTSVDQPPAEPYVTATNDGRGIQIISELSANAVCILRLMHGQPYVEFEYIVGPLNVSDGIGKEFIVKYDSDVASGDRWYTDSNGLEFIERKRNYRKTWNYQVNEPVAGNYVPMNTAAYLKDAQKQITILTDRSQGCASLNSGSFEVMLQRRLLHDDGRGVAEALDEVYGAQVRTVHRLFLHAPGSAADEYRPWMQRVNQPLEPIFQGQPPTQAPGSSATGQYLEMPLPPEVRVVTMRSMENGEVLLRLQHIYAVDESERHSKRVTVDIKNLFPKNVHVGKITETTITANQDLSTVQRMPWNLMDGTHTPASPTGSVVPGTTLVKLYPMDIRTFLVTVQE